MKKLLAVFAFLASFAAVASAEIYPNGVPSPAPSPARSTQVSASGSTKTAVQQSLSQQAASWASSNCWYGYSTSGITWGYSQFNGIIEYTGKMTVKCKVIY